jgi:HTH-type transcriptional regulator / antitoxin HigA
VLREFLNAIERTMRLQIIKTEKEYQDLLEWVGTQFDLDITPESKEGEDLQIALLLIKQFEDLHYTIPLPPDSEDIL